MSKKEEGEGWEFSKDEPIDDVGGKFDEEVLPDLFNIWLPKVEGETLIGEVVEVGEMQFGITAQVKKPDGEIVQTPAHKILQSRIEKVTPGDHIKIVYLGMTKTQGGRDVNNYQLFKKPAAAAVSSSR